MLQDPNVERVIKYYTEPLQKQISMLQIELEALKKQCNIANVGKRIYLTFADHTCDGAYSTLEKANERMKQIKDEYPDMDGVYVISREVE